MHTYSEMKSYFYFKNTKTVSIRWSTGALRGWALCKFYSDLTDTPNLFDHGAEESATLTSLNTMPNFFSGRLHNCGWGTPYVLIVKVFSRGSDSEWQKCLCSPWLGAGAYYHKQLHKILNCKKKIL